MRRPSAALVIACLALVVAVMGSGLGAAARGRYTITSPAQIKPGVIKTKHLSKKTVAGLRGAVGPTGAQGATGASGATGARGPSEAWLISALGEANGVTLAPGAYLVNGTVSVTGNSDSTNCALSRRVVGAGGYSSRLFFSPGTSTRSLAVSEALRPSAPTTVFLTCDYGGTVTPLVTIVAVASLDD